MNLLFSCCLGITSTLLLWGQQLHLVQVQAGQTLHNMVSLIRTAVAGH